MFKKNYHISEWKSKGLSDEIIKPPSTSGNSLAPELSYSDMKTTVKLAGSCLKQDKVTFTHGKIVNIYTVYEISLWNYAYSSDPTLGKLVHLHILRIRKKIF